MQIEALIMTEQEVNEERYHVESASNTSICSYEDSTPPEQTITKACCKCKGCEKLITDAELLKVDDDIWHVNCLCCCICEQTLVGSATCFVKNGNYYCRQHYKDLRTVKSCSHCCNHINPRQFIMRVRDNIYHYNSTCFACCFCTVPLERGQCFYIDGHYLMCISCAQSPTFHTKNDCPKLTLNKPGRPRKKKQTIPTSHLDTISGISINFTANDNQGANEHQNYQQPKAKRLRTSFKYNQLNMMKAYFQQNHNPDAKQLKQLTVRTGLSKRVLQVWFQNARAKHRRMKGREQDGIKRTSEQQTIDSEVKTEATQDSNCSDSFSSTIGTSPGSDTICFDTSSHCDEFEQSVLSPFDQYSTSFAQSSVASACQLPNYVGPLTPLPQASSAPMSPGSRTLETT